MTAAAEMMPGPDGTLVKCYRRSARQVLTGDYLPDYGAHAVGESLEDPDDGSVWVTLDTGQDVRVTTRKVWLYRRYAAPDWMRDALEAYRAARDARDALRESSAPIPAGLVAGMSGAGCAWYQLERDAFNDAVPAPRLADYIREAAAARRAPESVAS